MSNIAFDRLVARQNLQNAKSAVRDYGSALVRTDLAPAELSFLVRAFNGAKEWQAQAQGIVDGGWGW